MRRSSPLALVGLVAVFGCGQDQPQATKGPGGTATVLADGIATTFAIDTCEREGGIVTLTAHGESDESLEVTAEVGGDGETLAPADASSLTALGLEQGDLSAVGPEAWAERGMSGEPPGDVAASRITGNLVQMAGARIAVIDEDGQPTGDELESFSLDASCEEVG